MIFSVETQLNEEILTKIDFKSFFKMPQRPIESVLKNFFTESTRSDWKNIAMQETGGKNPFEALSWRGKDQILFLPYYDAQHVAELHFIKDFRIPASKNTDSGPRSWINLPAVSAADSGNANSIALEHLSGGAEGILFELQGFDESALNGLMHQIEWPYCFMAFQVRDNTSFPKALSEFIITKFNPASVTGALFWESSPKKSTLDFFFNQCKNFYALGLCIRSSSPSGEISTALLEGISVFENFSSGSNDDQVFRSIAFSLPADASILETAAKFKALRMLWTNVAALYGHHDYEPDDLHIHARSPFSEEGAYSPNENMLKGTFASMAAVLGGCNSLTVMAEEKPSHIPRWARNVSAILRDESFLNTTPDPLNGAYALDSMVDDIARKAWEMFQLKWGNHETTA